MVSLGNSDLNALRNRQPHCISAGFEDPRESVLQRLPAHLAVGLQIVRKNIIERHSFQVSITTAQVRKGPGEDTHVACGHPFLSTLRVAVWGCSPKEREGRGTLGLSAHFDKS